LQLDAGRGLTLEQAIYEWAPLGDGANDPAKYLADVLAGFQAAGCDTVCASMPLSLVLKFQAAP
jgi:hypothetical protein